MICAAPRKAIEDLKNAEDIGERVLEMLGNQKGVSIESVDMSMPITTAVCVEFKGNYTISFGTTELHAFQHLPDFRFRTAPHSIATGMLLVLIWTQAR